MEKNSVLLALAIGLSSTLITGFIQTEKSTEIGGYYYYEEPDIDYGLPIYWRSVNVITCNVVKFEVHRFLLDLVFWTLLWAIIIQGSIKTIQNTI